MKKVLIPIAIAIAMLLPGCAMFTPFNTAQLYRHDTSFDAFMNDRESCVTQARSCIAEKYKDSYYRGEPVEKLYPSRGVYLACMKERSYFVAPNNGYVPKALVQMNDYEPGRDCFGR